MELLISYLSRTTPIEFTFGGEWCGCFVVTFIGVSWGAFKYKQSAEKLLVKVKTRKTTRNIWCWFILLMVTSQRGKFCSSYASAVVLVLLLLYIRSTSWHFGLLSIDDGDYIVNRKGEIPWPSKEISALNNTNYDWIQLLYRRRRRRLQKVSKIAK